MRLVRLGFSILVSLSVCEPFNAYAQKNLTPEEKALKEKLVQTILKFDNAIWEQTKAELRNSDFPVYSLMHASVQEAYFRLEHVYGITDDSVLRARRYYKYSSLITDFGSKIAHPRLQEDYLRVMKLVEKHQTRIPAKEKLTFSLDENRNVKAVYYYPNSRKKPLTKEIETSLLTFLQNQNFQAYENREIIANPKLQNKKRSSLKRRWKRFKQLFESAPNYPHYKFKGRYYRRYE